MQTRVRYGCLLTALTALVLVLAPPAADGTVLKHKKTGETIEGQVLDQKAGGLNVFKTADGRTRFIQLDDWKVVDDKPAKPATPPPEKPAPPKPAPAQPAPQPAAPAAPDAPKSASSTRAYFIPLSGPIEHRCLAEAIEKALQEAKAQQASFVVVHIDTPGGYVHVADKIIGLIEGVDWATTVSWVEGAEKRALSAGAYICMATHKIFMAPGTTIGAATPYHIGETGSAEVDEKFKSAFRARFRSLAQQRGQFGAIADAMVDNSLSAVQIWVDGIQTVVPEEEAKRLEREHANDGKFKLGRTIAERGKLLTLTSQEALELKVASGIAATRDELMAQLGCRDAEIAEAAWLPIWVTTTTDKRNKAVEKQQALFDQNLRQAILADPRGQAYAFADGLDTFTDSGRLWRDHTDKCLNSLKACAKALTELEKLSKDERYDFPVSESSLRDMKMDMQAFYTRLNAERSAKRRPSF